VKLGLKFSLDVSQDADGSWTASDALLGVVGHGQDRRSAISSCVQAGIAVQDAMTPEELRAYERQASAAYLLDETTHEIVAEVPPPR
jgi:hypothetical protein